MRTEFQVPGGVFSVRLVPTLITLVMLTGLISLGCWQITRLHWKENLLITIHARMDEDPVDVSAVKRDEADYRPAYAIGAFNYEHEIYIHAVSRVGEGGYHVLTTLKIDDDHYLLVDRGFVPYSVNRLPPFYRPNGQVTIRGTLRVPQHHWPQLNNNPKDNDWYWPDLKALAHAMGVPEFMPFVLEVDGTMNSLGFPLGGQTRLDIPNNHFVYALTWFGLALALLVIYGASGYSKEDEGE
jgi:surfeit locus 1 family protein